MQWVSFGFLCQFSFCQLCNLDVSFIQKKKKKALHFVHSILHVCNCMTSRINSNYIPKLLNNLTPIMETHVSYERETYLNIICMKFMLQGVNFS
jgi:hypothetical protein